MKPFFGRTIFSKSIFRILLKAKIFFLDHNFEVNFSKPREMACHLITSPSCTSTGIKH